MGVYVCVWLSGCVSQWVGSGQITINQDDSILFEDLCFVETPQLWVGGCVGGWMDGCVDVCVMWNH